MKRIFASFLLILCILLVSCNYSSSLDSTEADTKIDSNESSCLSSDTSTSSDTCISTDVGTSTNTNTSTNTDTSTDTDTCEGTPKAKNDAVPDEENMEFILKGVIKSVSTGLEIEVIESDYAFGIYHIIVPSHAPIYDQNGNFISLSDLSKNDIVLINYSGQTMLSYPPQVVAYSIIKQ